MADNVGVLTAAPSTASHRADATRTRARQLLRQHRGLLLGGVVLVILGLAAICAPLLTEFNPRATNPRVLNVSPGTDGHLLGTDHLGRDVFARTLYGARISLIIGLAAGTLSLLLGVLAGSLAGFGPTWIDLLITRLIDLLLALPMLVLVIAISAMLQPSPAMVVVVIALLGWVSVARVVRAQFIVLRETEYTVAAQALGASRLRIAARHILPNALAPILAIASFEVAGAMLTEAGLSFLGLGVPESTPTWGTMLASGQETLLLGHWWTTAAPAAAMTITIVAINLVADDIRLRHST